jgi:hypothetical protein
MNSTLWLLGSTIALGLLTLTFMLVVMNQLTQNRQLQRANRTLSIGLQKSSEKQSELVDKLVTMMGTKDPLAYQQVMAMQNMVVDEPYDPSDAGELRRIAERNAGLLNDNATHGADATDNEFDPFAADVSDELARAFGEATGSWPEDRA